MKQDLEDYISRNLDGELSAEEQLLLEQALAESEDLSHLSDDLLEIKQLTDQPAPPCPPHLLPQMMEQVEATYAKQGPWYQFLFSPAMAAAYLLLLLVGAAAFMIKNPPGITAAPLDLAAINQEAFAAQIAYQKALSKMEEVAVSHLEQMQPDMALVYAENLRIINRAIADCHQLIEQHPEYLPAWQSLNRAYASKTELLEKIIAG